MDSSGGLPGCKANIFLILSVECARSTILCAAGMGSSDPWLSCGGDDPRCWDECPRNRDQELLGLSEDWTHEELKSAFKTAALASHPDKGGTAKAFRKFQEAKVRLVHGRERQEEEGHNSAHRPGLVLGDFIKTAKPKKGQKQEQRKVLEPARQQQEEPLQSEEATLKDVENGDDEIVTKRMTALTALTACQVAGASESAIEAADLREAPMAAVDTAPFAKKCPLRAGAMDAEVSDLVSAERSWFSDFFAVFGCCVGSRMSC